MSMNCPSCGDPIQIGDWPFCSGPGSHQSVFQRDSLNFPAIVLFKDLSTGEVYPAAHTSESTPHLHERIEIRDMRTADFYIRQINSREREKAVDRREMNRLYFEERTKERREKVDSLLASGKLSNRARWLAEKARAYANAKHEKRFSKPLDPHAHFQALSFDSSNRMPYSSPETGWKDRKA